MSLRTSSRGRSPFSSDFPHEVGSEDALILTVLLTGQSLWSL